jgi:hypothetical protein
MFHRTSGQDSVGQQSTKPKQQIPLHGHNRIVPPEPDDTRRVRSLIIPINTREQDATPPTLWKGDPTPPRSEAGAELEINAVSSANVPLSRPLACSRPPGHRVHPLACSIRPPLRVLALFALPYSSTVRGGGDGLVHSRPSARTQQ